MDKARATGVPVDSGNERVIHKSQVLLQAVKTSNNVPEAWLYLSGNLIDNETIGAVVKASLALVIDTDAGLKKRTGNAS